MRLTKNKVVSVVFKTGLFSDELIFHITSRSLYKRAVINPAGRNFMKNIIYAMGLLTLIAVSAPEVSAGPPAAY